jgi:hypothetical protein
MTLNEFIRMSPMLYSTRKTYYLLSDPGIGKSTAQVEAVGVVSRALKINLGTIIINGGLLNPPDAVGYLMPFRDEQKRLSSMFTEPFWFMCEPEEQGAKPKHMSEYDGVVIIIEEADKMDIEVKKVMGEMCLSRRLGPHRLRDTDVIWMNGNFPQNRSGSTKELDHLINRRCQLHVRFDFDSWELWCAKHGIAATTIAFVRENMNLVVGGTPKDQGPWCTPRSIVAMSEVLMQFSEDGHSMPVKSGLMLELCAGFIGEGAAAQFFSFAEYERELPELEEVIKNPKEAKLPSHPGCQMLACYKLAALAEEKTIEPIVEYVERMPKDFSVTFAKVIGTRSIDLLNTKAMTNWCIRNHSLMAAVVELKA